MSGPVTGRHVKARRGRHRASSRGQGSGVALAVLVVVGAAAVVGRSPGASASDSPVASHLQQVTTVAQCRTQASALLADDLARVVSGMPDARATASSMPGSPIAPEALAAHDALVGQATSDALNRFHRDASALLAHYGDRIDQACRAGGAR